MLSEVQIGWIFSWFFVAMFRTLKYGFPQKNIEFLNKKQINYEFLKHQTLKKQNKGNLDLEIEFFVDCLQRHL
jgi:hypothetical protein